MAGAFRTVYGAFPPLSSEGVFDATASVRAVSGLRSFLRPQVELVADGQRLFEPFPAANHLPLLEWGLNYLIATRVNHRLLLHAGAVERGGVGLLLPALPGSGKSTLCAALVCHGYRLLSDEFGVVDLQNGALLPLLRPIGLKNESIDVIARLAPASALGPRFNGTRKGSVAHLAPGQRAVRLSHVPAVPGVILFPQYEAGARVTLDEIDPARAFSKLSINAFNYRLLGRSGFDAVARLVRTCVLRRLVFSDLVEAIHAIDALVDGLRTPAPANATDDELSTASLPRAAA
jgi:HprK-related kinase A